MGRVWEGYGKGKGRVREGLGRVWEEYGKGMGRVREEYGKGTGLKSFWEKGFENKRYVNGTFGLLCI